jgi:hypothetical protein
LPRVCAGSFNAGTGIYKMGNVFKTLLPKTAAARLAAGTKVGGASARDYLLRFPAPWSTSGRGTDNIKNSDTLKSL